MTRRDGALDHGEGPPLLVIVPRHPRRGRAVVDLLRKRHPEWHIVLYTEMAGDSSSQSEFCHTGVLAAGANGAGPGTMMPLSVAHVLVVNSLGVLGDWYTLADVAFVGGSLVDGIGGHNVLEPAMLGCVALHGPFMHNGQHLVDALRSCDRERDTERACVRGVSSAANLSAAVMSVLRMGRGRGPGAHGSLRGCAKAAVRMRAEGTMADEKRWLMASRGRDVRRNRWMEFVLTCDLRHRPRRCRAKRAEESPTLLQGQSERPERHSCGKASPRRARAWRE